VVLEAPLLPSGRRLRLRPLEQSDRHVWRQLRQRNARWLAPWDATPPANSPGQPRSFSAMVRAMRREGRAGRQLPFVLDLDGHFVGQLSVNNVVRGSAQFASIGYWIDQQHAGQGIVPVAVAVVIDHCFGPVGLHRVEVAIRPENLSSLRVVEKLGLTEVGYAPGYLHIDGDWRDHRIFALTREELSGSMLERLAAGDSQQSHE
jgi:ribosomal-protein-alanine N-acetyltransferase